MNQQHPKVGVGIMVFKKEDGKTYVILHQRKNALGRSYLGGGGSNLKLGESLLADAMPELAEEAGAELQVNYIEL